MSQIAESQNGRQAEDVATLLKEKSGIQLDIGCGANKQAGYIGMDYQPLDGVDIVHDVLHFPWPLPDESCVRAICSHLVEHIPPHPRDPLLRNLVQFMIDEGQITSEGADATFGDWNDTTPRFIRFMNEVWRVLKPGSQFAVFCPHGYSPGQLQDPSHVNASNENTWAYFDPLIADSLLYNFYKPKPWQIVQRTFNPAGNMEILLKKVEEVSDE